MLASSTTWSHLHARSPCVFHEFRIAGVRPPELSIIATCMDAPGLSNDSFRDGSKVEIAAMYPDFVSGSCLLSLMEFAGRRLINAASFTLVLQIRLLLTAV